MDAVLLLTDLEPDDVIALRMLKNSKMVDDKELLVVVGEGNKSKVQLAVNVLEFYKFTNYTVLEGVNSNKDYPSSCLESYPVVQVNRTSKETVEQFLTRHTMPVILCLKPPYELLDLDSSLLKKCQLSIYGSFNLRSVIFRFKKENKTYDLASFLNNSFARVLLYESFYATGSNSLNKSLAPDMFNKLEKDEPFMTLMHGWNQFIVKDCLETTVELSNKMLLEFSKTNINYKQLRDDYNRMVDRNLKIVGSMVDEKAEGTQTVLADFGLVAVVCNLSKFMGSLSRGTVSFDDTGYTQFTENAESSLYLVRNVDFDLLVSTVTDMV